MRFLLLLLLPLLAVAQTDNRILHAQDRERIATLQKEWTRSTYELWLVRSYELAAAQQQQVVAYQTLEKTTLQHQEALQRKRVFIGTLTAKEESLLARLQQQLQNLTLCRTQAESNYESSLLQIDTLLQDPVYALRILPTRDTFRAYPQGVDLPISNDTPAALDLEQGLRLR